MLHSLFFDLAIHGHYEKILFGSDPHEVRFRHVLFSRWQNLIVVTQIDHLRAELNSGDLGEELGTSARVADTMMGPLRQRDLLIPDHCRYLVMILDLCLRSAELDEFAAPRSELSTSVNTT